MGVLGLEAHEFTRNRQPAERLVLSSPEGAPFGVVLKELAPAFSAEPVEIESTPSSAVGVLELLRGVPRLKVVALLLADCCARMASISVLDKLT